MPRPPIYYAPMKKIIKFRATDEEIRMLSEMKSEDQSTSELLRTIVRETYERTRT